MPIFDFKCSRCNKIFEKIVSSRSSGETSPPSCECGGTTVLQEVTHRKFGPNSNDSSVRVHINWLPPHEG